MKNYPETKNQDAPMVDCFFAFSNEQFAEGIKKHNLEDKKILRGMAGLYGTKEGIQNFYSFYDRLNEEIKRNCDPQQIYDYEFSNHECSYTNDDSEAMKIVLSYFDEEKCKTIKRKYAYTPISELIEEMAKINPI